MNREWAIIENTLVINTIVWDGETNWQPPAGTFIVEITNLENAPSIGWSYIDGQFVAPVEPEEIVEEVLDETLEDTEYSQIV